MKKDNLKHKFEEELKSLHNAVASCCSSMYPENERELSIKKLNNPYYAILLNKDVELLFVRSFISEADPMYQYINEEVEAIFIYMNNSEQSIIDLLKEANKITLPSFVVPEFESMISEMIYEFFFNRPQNACCKFDSVEFIKLITS